MNDERATRVVGVLRALARGAAYSDALLDAADELERLREALRPFAALGGIDRDRVGLYLTKADLNRAAEVLK